MEKPNTETFHCLLLWQVFCGNGAMTSQWWLGLSGGLSKINQSSQALKTHLHLGLWKSATNVNGKPNTETFHCLLAGLLWKWSHDELLVAGTERWPVQNQPIQPSIENSLTPRPLEVCNKCEWKNPTPRHSTVCSCGRSFVEMEPGGWD